MGPANRRKFFASFFQKRSAFLLLFFTSPASAACTMHRAATLPLTLFDEKLYVPATINGTPAEFFIDTGAGVTTISQATADALTLPRDFDHSADMFGVGGKENHLGIVQVESLTLGGIQILNHAFPSAGFAQRLADGTPIAGLIGADILSNFDVELDIPHRQLALWRVSGCTEITPDWQGASLQAPMQVAETRHATVPVTIDGAHLDLLIDTGSPSLVLSTRAAARAGATPEILEQGRSTQGFGVNDHPFTAWLHIFPRMELAGRVFGDVRTIVVTNGRYLSTDGLLGLEYLKRSPVWLSYSTGTFFMENP